jgi:histidine triad (HIT) family protein
VNADCIFCRIVTGELPSVKVHEDDDTLAFMDIGPVIKGHTLVIPREHYDPITGTPPETMQKLVVVVQKIAQAQYKGLGADGVNVMQANGAVAGQVVPHIHFHVIPRFAGDGHSWNWKAGEYENDEEMSRYAADIKAAFAG